MPVGAEPGFASNARRQVLDSCAAEIPVPGTCWGRRAMSFASILLPFGSRIPVPGTCWGQARFASNAGRQVPDPGARHLLGPPGDGFR